MARHHFPGFPAFLDRAAAEIDKPGAAGPAGRIETLAAAANLCAQAAEADEAHVEGILERAAELRDPLRAALRAVELMIDDVRAARAPSRTSPETTTPTKRGRRQR